MSAIYDQSSLVFLPSGYKDGKLYSQKPLSTSGELAFSRGSDIEATRVNANGYIEKAKVNLLLQSNTFDTTWTSARISLLDGQAGYDGTNNAWKITPNTDNNTHVVVQAGAVAANGVYNFSVYAKANGYNYIALRDSASVDGYARFDLQNGLTSTSGTSAISSKITSVGGGWYRCELSVNKTSGGADNFIIYTNETYSFNEVYVGDGTSSVLIQSAQANYGLVAQTYQETTTAAVVSGITNDMPRLSYDPANPTCPSLLLEGSRTNLINHSDWFGGHTLFASNVATNSLTSPEGVLNGSEVRANSGISLSISTANGYTAGASAYVAKNVGTLTASTYTFSTFVKKTDLNLIQIRTADDSDLSSATGAGAIIDLDTYTVVYESNCTTTIEPYALGWYRVSITFTATAATWYAGYWYWNKTSITVDGTQGYGVYGSQLELGSYPTSLVPSYGSSATRTADSAIKTGISSLIGQTEGTLYLEFSTQPEGTGDSRISISDGSAANWIFLSKDGPEYRTYVRASNVVLYSNNSEDILDSSIVKMAIAYKNNDIAYYFNGTLRSSSASVAFSNTLDRLIFGSNNVASDVNEAIKINQVLLFKSRLSNADLATLTTL